MSAMKTFVGIDLGSTTTKAVLLDENGDVLGRGITNSRSNYDTACRVAQQEALVDARFTLFRRQFGSEAALSEEAEAFLDALEQNFRLEQYLEQLADLEETCTRLVRGERFAKTGEGIKAALAEIFARLRAEAPALYGPNATRKSDFFRDIAGSRYITLAEEISREMGVANDALINLYDKSIIAVENRPPAGSLDEKFQRALKRVTASGEGVTDDLAQKAKSALGVELEETYLVGTGYGRVTLPFSKEHIRSEILCHGLGAHMMYPKTRTVLDIGGQDTKGIQVDENGIVENFQMNDRCAAGCGRYLGYIADEMNMGLHELGPLAMKSSRPARINSTCTVFAGAELRDRLALGEKREDILAGLHRAIILRAISILSRSGGVQDQMTFTGGVAKNEAAVRELKKLIRENYGDVTINIDPDSIYTGSLGAAEFARRAAEGRMEGVEA